MIGTRFGGRRTAVTALVAGWIAITAAAAGRSADGKSWLGLPPTEWLAYVMMALIVIGALIGVVAVILAGQERREKPQRRRRRPLWPMLLLLLAIVALSQRALPPPPEDEEEPLGAAPTEEAADDDEGLRFLTAGEGTALLLLVAVAVAVFAAGRRAQDLSLPPAAAASDPEPTLAPAVERATAALFSDRDPRAAVLRAYRDLEDSLAAQGRPRRPTETPTEHLRRVLASERLDTGPLLALAELYELARFSEHAITADDQRLAAASLERVRAQLAATA